MSKTSIIARRCMWCDRVFLPAHHKQRYCSEECARAAKRHKMAERFAEVRKGQGAASSNKYDIMPAGCAGCVYRRPIAPSAIYLMACHYAIDTDELRGCSAKECAEKKIHYRARPDKGSD